MVPLAAPDTVSFHHSWSAHAPDHELLTNHSHRRSLAHDIHRSVVQWDLHTLISVVSRAGAEERSDRRARRPQWPVHGRSRSSLGRHRPNSGARWAPLQASNSPGKSLARRYSETRWKRSRSAFSRDSNCATASRRSSPTRSMRACPRSPVRPSCSPSADCWS